MIIAKIIKFLCILFCIPYFIWAKEDMGQLGELATAKKIESQILSATKGKVSDKNIAMAYNASGREYFVLHKYLIATYLLQKSLILSKKNNFDNSEAYSLLIQIDLLNQKFDEGLKLLEKFEAHIQAQRKTPYKEEQELFDYYFLKLTNKTCASTFAKDKCTELLKSPKFGHDILWREVKLHIFEGKNQDAYNYLMGIDFNQMVINQKIIADLLNYLLKKKEKLMCLDLLLKYPESKKEVYTMALCDILNDKMAGKKISKKQFKSFEVLLKEYPEENYLLKVVSDLK